MPVAPRRLRLRRPPRRAATSVALLLVVLAAAAGCGRITGPREWTLSASRTDGSSYTIDVRDTSGRLDDVEIDPQGVPPFGPVSNPNGLPNVVLVPWTGGSCDTRTDIAIAANGQGLGVTVATTVSGQVCDLVGVGHVLRLTGSTPIPAATVTVQAAPSR